MKHTVSLAVVMALILVTWASAQDLEKAKQEGHLVFYTSWGLSDADYVIKIFEKKYPFLKIELARSTSEKTLNRLLTEHRAQSFLGDVEQLGKEFKNVFKVD